MKFAALLPRISLVVCSAIVVLWLGGCAGYGTSNGYKGGGGTGTIPTAPTGFVATAGNAQVALTWSASSGATGYYIKRSTSTGNETQIAAQSATS